MNLSIKGKLLKNEKLAEQAASNTEEQFERKTSRMF
jgi:hypothetical protein